MLFCTCVSLGFCATYLAPSRRADLARFLAFIKQLNQTS
eukprot:UN09738